MREEYFMNFDFLRKFRDKTDPNGLSFRMLDFEDGGMYFGVVSEDLPSGLGAFVYSDLKFHCGVYREGLMSGLARIHFGNGDVYDGDTKDGKMEGKGFFFDCENNDWMFGSFEDDNCLEVIHRGEGFPKQQIIKYRANLHQQASHFYNRATDQFNIDIDLLIELANKDLSHLKFEIDQAIQTPLKSPSPEEADGAFETKEDLHEFYKKALDSQEHLRDIKKSQSSGQTIVKSKSQNIWSKKTKETPGDSSSLLLQDIHIIKPSVSDHELSTKTKRKSDREGIKKSPGNQIVQDVQVLKPRQNKMLSVEVQTTSLDIELPRAPPTVAPEHQASHNSSMHNESRELRNISVQTEVDRSEASQHQDANLSYLKSIHTMVDELKTLLSKNHHSASEKELDGSFPFASKLQADEWNRHIDEHLQYQRQLELQQLMSQKFGAVEIEDADIDHAVNPLEPIKEIGEDEDEADPHPLLAHNESSIEKKDDELHKYTDDNFFPQPKPPASSNYLQINLDVKESRESNFMHSHNVTMSDRQKHLQWYMFNPYLYEVADEVNTG